jgi:hypothetical protein
VGSVQCGELLGKRAERNGLDAFAAGAAPDLDASIGQVLTQPMLRTLWRKREDQTKPELPEAFHQRRGQRRQA